MFKSKRQFGANANINPFNDGEEVTITLKGYNYQLTRVGREDAKARKLFANLTQLDESDKDFESNLSDWEDEVRNAGKESMFYQVAVIDANGTTLSISDNGFTTKPTLFVCEEFTSPKYPDSVLKRFVKPVTEKVGG